MALRVDFRMRIGLGKHVAQRENEVVLESAYDTGSKLRTTAIILGA